MRMLILPLIIIAVLITAGIGITSYLPLTGFAAGPAGPEASIPQLSLEGFSEADIGLSPAGSGILLTSGCSQLSMVTSPEQAYSISLGLAGTMGMRPLAHDLIENIASRFGIEVLMARVESLREGTYYAKLVLRQGSTILNMDSRPSDAISVAVRTNSPVYVSNELLEEHARDICQAQ